MTSPDDGSAIPPVLPVGDDRLVFCAAAPAEARAVATGLGMDPGVVCSEAAGAWRPVSRVVERGDGSRRELVLLQTGVGKVNAAAAVTAYLVRTGGTPVPRATVVVSVGVAGTLPGSPLEVGDTILGSVSCYADEGVALPEGDGEGFVDMGTVGFGYGVPLGKPVMGVGGSPGVLRGVQGVFAGAGRPLKVGTIATVSTCSGTDGLARAVAARTGAWAEAMEGAAIGHVVHRLSTLGINSGSFSDLLFCELRVISNTTGDRGGQRWNLSAALAHLSEAVRLATGILLRD